MNRSDDFYLEIDNLLEQNYTPLAVAQTLDIPIQWVYNVSRYRGRDDYSNIYLDLEQE